MSDIFPRLISPVDPRFFFERHWARQYLLVPHPSGHYDDWLTLQDIDLLLQSEDFPAAFCNVISGGVPLPIEDWSRTSTSARGSLRTVDPERVLQSYLNGATVILNGVQRTIPPLSRACRLLTRELGIHAWTNVYISPPGSTGFARHRDDHEVFVLQIFGAKLWNVYPDPGDPVELQLKPGSMLYLPRYVAHEARSGNTCSIHVTLGLKPTYTFDLIEVLAAAAKRHPAFQQPAPRALSTAAAMDDFEAELAGKLVSLLRETTIAGLLEMRVHALSENQGRGWPGRFADIVHLHDISPRTIVRTRAGILFAIKEEGASIAVSFAGKQVSIPSFLAACLRQITGEAPFAIEELSGLISTEGKVDLVRSFLRTGLLEIVEI